ncbi:YfcC family protein [Psychrobacter phenylpyruvicus]|uniref:C4-dicarboxylate anaerobic carrier n=1 Tax=Psychrobacter phenylpyruvicus TaxID=29432 RepID=A0A379LNI6_9GAMM|nr:YfcC family protein [Psychrobacter phenylpyruvicus]SUD89715.1 C4-dicarboxylate anaerobic carrier [Psychrobacter phenylpyruvicus]SUD92160.1 C4-dicarboxylate anaerobic carrier [Psychrobacter phenylpyruvicus]
MVHFKFPTAYTILFSLIVIMAALTWIIPAGQYDLVHSAELGKDIPVAGTFHYIESNRQGIVDILMAPINGFYDHTTGQANAVDVAVFVLIIGAFIAVATKSGAIDAGIARSISKLEGREKWIIPIIMGLLAIGGTTYGMAEETLAFYAIVIPVMIAAGYDALTGVAIVMVGAGIGVLGSTINPFSTVIAANAAGINFIDGIWLRVFILIAGWAICAGYVMRYAAKVKKDPSSSLVADLKQSNERYFLGQEQAQKVIPELNRQRKLILFVFCLTFVVLIYGVALAGWWMTEMGALFLGSTILIGIIARMNEEDLTTTIVDGAQDLLGVAIIIALARGIVVIMDDGNITPTILHAAEIGVQDMSTFAFINGVYWIEMFMSLVVPSSSGLAVLTMPIMAPLADFAGVDRSLVVTAFQSACGLPNLITPTSGVVMGGLVLGRVSYGIWFKFMWPLLLMLITLVTIVLNVGIFLS